MWIVTIRSSVGFSIPFQFVYLGWYEDGLEELVWTQNVVEYAVVSKTNIDDLISFVENELHTCEWRAFTNAKHVLRELRHIKLTNFISFFERCIQRSFRP